MLEEGGNPRYKPITLLFLMASVIPLSLLLLHVFLCFSVGVHSKSLKIANECRHTVWPALVSGSGTPPLLTAALALQPNKSITISLPAFWSGWLWGRTFCSYNAIGRLACATGDCGSGSPECASASAQPPVTMAEFTLSGDGNLDFYVVSASRGYNLGILVVPHHGSGGDCMATGCVKVVESFCQSEQSGGCNSTCFGYSDPKYCCSGANTPPDTCKPSPYSQYFISKCPWAYRYANDDGNSMRKFNCASSDYFITFCPRRSPATGQESFTGAVSGTSGVKMKKVIIIVLVVLTAVIAVLLIVYKILRPGLVVSIVSAIYTALGLLFAFL